MQDFIEKVKFYIVAIGLIGLIMGIINTFKHNFTQAKTGYIFFGVAVVVVALSLISSRIIEKRQSTKKNQSPAVSVTPPQPPVLPASPAKSTDPLTVLGMLVLLERPLRFATDKELLIRSIIDQQSGEFHRLIAPSAQVQIIVASTNIDDDAYIYGACRSAFDKLDTSVDNDEFLGRVATGSFTASDGNRGKHFAFLNKKM